jgi:Putative Actinobacterial Holin-X, holin superfamily III
MDSNSQQDEAPGQTTAKNDAASPPSVLEDTQALLAELRGLGFDHLRLAALETQRAGESLVSMVMAGVMVAILLMAAWLGLLAALVLWVMFNLLLALLCCGVIRRKKRYLHYPSTLRSFQNIPSKQQNTGQP